MFDDSWYKDSLIKKTQYDIENKRNRDSKSSRSL